MRTFKLSDYGTANKLWLFGDFEPALLRTKSFEVGLHSHKKNEPTIPHRHLLTDEYNVVLKGKLRVSGVEVNEGEVFLFNRGEISDVEFLEDTQLLVVRDGSFPSDKVIV